MRALYMRDTGGLDLLAKDTIRLLIARTALQDYDPRAGSAESAALLRDAQGAIDSADAAWKAFAVLASGHEEQALIETAGTARKQLVQQTLLPAVEALESKRASDIREFNENQIKDAFNAYDSALQPLVAMEFEHGKARFEASQRRTSTVIWIASTLLAAGLVLAFFSRVAS